MQHLSRAELELLESKLGADNERVMILPSTLRRLISMARESLRSDSKTDAWNRANRNARCGLGWMDQ
jgi:hypothetical protein